MAVTPRSHDDDVAGLQPQRLTSGVWASKVIKAVFNCDDYLTEHNAS